MKSLSLRHSVFLSVKLQILTGFPLSVVCASQHIPSKCIHTPNLTNPISLPERSPHLTHPSSFLTSFKPLPILDPSISSTSIAPYSQKASSKMAMILQCLGSNGRPLPYFIIGPHPQVAHVPHTSACLMADYHYPCSNHCLGLSVPWPGHVMQFGQAVQGGYVVPVAQLVPRQNGYAPAVAPMIALDIPGQLAQDVCYSVFYHVCWKALGSFLTSLFSKRSSLRYHMRG